MVSHIVLYAALAGDISVPALKRGVDIVLRERTQKLMKLRIGIVKYLLMKPAAELRHI